MKPMKPMYEAYDTWTGGNAADEKVRGREYSVLGETTEEGTLARYLGLRVCTTYVPLYIPGICTKSAFGRDQPRSAILLIRSPHPPPVHSIEHHPMTR